MLLSGDVGRLDFDAETKTGDQKLVYRPEDGVIYTTSGVNFDNTVVVKTPDDLQNIDSTKNYMIDGFIDINPANKENLEAARSIPSDSTPLMVAGSKLLITSMLLPTNSS